VASAANAATEGVVVPPPSVPRALALLRHSTRGALSGAIALARGAVRIARACYIMASYLAVGSVLLLTGIHLALAHYQTQQQQRRAAAARAGAVIDPLAGLPPELRAAFQQ
jgi:hypothetical protein